MVWRGRADPAPRAFTDRAAYQSKQVQWPAAGAHEQRTNALESGVPQSESLTHSSFAVWQKKPTASCVVGGIA